MRALLFVAITLLSGALAGTALGVINQGVVEPFIERAIEIETQGAAAAGEMIDPTELEAYRLWQRSGSIAGGAVLGMSYGALFGVVFAYARKSLPGSTNVKKALVLAGAMWLVVYMLAAVKYPANPPAVGDPETIYYRQALYTAFVVISGLTALGMAYLYRLFRESPAKKALPALYAAVMAVAFATMPASPDPVTAPADPVNGFRVASAATMSVFWGLLGVVTGVLWDRTRPYEANRIATV